MKKIILLLFFASSLSAQKNTVEFSGGYTRFGTWDLNGTNFNFAYNRQVHKAIHFYSQLTSSSGILAESLGTIKYDGYPFAIFYASGVTRKLNLGPSVKFFREKRHNLNLSPMLSLVSYKYLSTGGFIRNTNSGVPVESLYFGLPFNYRSGYTMGFSAMAGYRFKINKNFSVGLDASLQNNIQGDGEINFNGVFAYSF